ncbi:UDP-glucuronic acid decarboxylase family protein [Aestuariivirga litoralis]|uniref:UDP-glucuronic acid decarboxylase family protein n=1 Tax=Aestuariivirga litoralis TaxID=2650924 RepID=UPI0018C50435|nr:UDP-glucuronic acid decarboxylase family protein [Aestuariivirga litoralis]MBG1232602.1 SDR family oxidoreductase [Aestuariivirga litoralis]
MVTSTGKKALVTGAAGFLGSHLVDKLLGDGWQVTGLDNLQTGAMQNLAHLSGNAKFNFIKHDVTEPAEIETDMIFNLACPASPPAYQADPIRTLKTSVLGAMHFLELAARQKAIFVQASTSEVYGDPLVHPQREDYWGHVNPIGIRSCYDEGKRAAETLCFDYRRKENVDVKVARIFNTYGPRMDPNDGRVVSNFIVQALKGEPITVYGDGLQTRSFCFVDDLIGAIHGLSKLPPGEAGPVNIGNPGEFTMLELAEQVLALTGSKSRLIYNPLPQDDPKQRKPDISRAQALMGWEPKVGLHEGLQKTIAYFSQRLKAA